MEEEKKKKKKKNQIYCAHCMMLIWRLVGCREGEKSSRGTGTESCHLPKSQKAKCQKAGLGNPLKPLVSYFGSRCRLLKKRFKGRDLIGRFQRVEQQI